MKKKTKIAVFCVLFGMLLAMAGYISSGVARADSARVTVTWTGAPCILVQEATGRIQAVCGGYASFSNFAVGVGVTTGVDPIMGFASSIGCSFYLNGVLEYSDFAMAGDGTDVNCLREIISLDRYLELA